MDKYTVDLDQVLNDFEYSELTDQYSNASRFATGTTSTTSQNNITKHSINNVFHSLNEYLNTSISVSGLNQIDNSIDIKNNYIEDVNVLSVSQSKFRDEEESIKDWNLKTDDRLLDITRDDDNVGEHEVKYLEEKGDNIVDSYKNNCDFESKETQEICPVSNESKELKGEGCVSDDKGKTDVICEESDVCDENVHVEVRIEENLEDEDKTLDINKEEFCKSQEDNSKIDSSDNSEVIKEADYSKEQERTVGFHDDLNLDDSEINRLLDELEDEGLEISEIKESQVITDVTTDTGNVEAVNETEESRESDVHPKVAVSVLEGTIIEENSHNELESPIEVHDLEINIENEDIKELEETTEDDGHSPLMQAEESNQNEEQSVVMVEPKLEHQNEEGGKGEEAVDVKLEEEKLKEVVEEVKAENEDKTLEIEKENSQDSLSRPQNLPLKGEGEEPKRKINLIGDPGSTPYNNVYINKEIPKRKQKAYDSDTDYSTSSSPTFSDVSSTASTVSADEVRIESDKKPQSQPNSSAAKDDVALETSEHTETANARMDSESPTPATENPPAKNSNLASDVKNGTSDKSEQSMPSSGGEETPQGNSGEDNLRTDLTGDTDEMSTDAPHVENMGEANVSAVSVGKQWLGKEAPLWIPDSDATSCLHCDMKFTVLKRRHHCRACGLVLCSKCCHLRFKLQYLEAEARVCNKCHDILNKDTNSSSGSDMSPDVGNSPSYRPHPNNPLEYCSTVSPLQQVASSNADPPAVMVPVGVLKRKGSNKGKSNKSVMFCDGIRPGSDLTNLDNDFDYNNTKTRKSEKASATPGKVNKNLPTLDPETNTFIPSSEHFLPPTVSLCKTDVAYMECSNNPSTVEMLKNEQLTFAIHVSLNVHLKIINMSCCINKMAWCFSTEGLINVGQDEIVILLEYIDEESFVPKDVFFHINNVYNDAVKGTSVKEMGLSLHNASNFLDSKNHAGFVYIRPTFQCLENVMRPKEPYLIGILIHRWETPWAKLFPLRLILRLGAEYRYYPSPIISTRHRESVFVEIGHTIINLLADFRNFSYTLPQIRGLTIHMEDKNTTITIPANRYDQVMKSMNNSSDHILAFAGNFSLQADSHLVCIQDTQGNENCYSTHAINIHNKPRKVTGASFIVFNGALKSSSGLTAKSNIVEDGLMIQVLPEHMQQIRETLRAMKNHTIACGCVNAASDETVNIVWGENDVNFNIGVVSAVDNMALNGIPSIRVHNGKNHVCVNGSRIIRWTEVFIIQSGDDNPKNQDPVDISRVSESIAKATCEALVKYLDLLVANNCQKIGIRTTLHVENVSYSAGSNGTKLPPIYMKSLDNELIPVLHRITTNNLGENAVVLELIFRILNI